MSVSDAILIGEDWISEHYFTTDVKKQSFKAQVLARRKVWDEQKDAGSVRSRFTENRGSLLSRLASLEDDPGLAADIRKDLIDILGYNALGLSSAVSGPVNVVRQISLMDGPAVAIVAAASVETVEDLLEKDVATLAKPYDVDDTTQIQSVSRLLSALFVGDNAPDFALVLAGRVALIAERERWPEGRYLAIDLQLICERSDNKKGSEIDTALACLSADSLAPDAEGNIWWHRVLEESINHTVGVSQDLREGVRLSIEIIANDVVLRRKNQGLPPLPDNQAQPLAKQSLRFLYRILFLLYAEASPELAVVPTGAPEYEQGYSLDRLRDLIQTPLTSPQAESGSHLYESLAVLFKLVDQGYTPIEAEEDEGLPQALTFRSLRADLFRPEATGLIDEVKLSNVELQRVLEHLLLSKQKRGSDRGFISYAELGINQLGAVYEGLMSYTGRFAETDLYEVAKGGDGSKGSWLVPVERAGTIDDKDFVRFEDRITTESKPVLHKESTFVFRLAGRERQQSASYYTPEVLTKFTVSQALEELLDQGEEPSLAEDILSMTVCEPALGSGAFAIEAVRQLAAEYLKRRQLELDERVDPEEYPKELQKVKAYLALHNVYGVDLNSTAVELAEISLWLDTMMEGLQAPWFGLHLRRGNSLIGARRAVYPRHLVEKKRQWLKAVPKDLPLTEFPEDVAEGRVGAARGSVHHFLLPAEGWGAAIKAKEAKELAPEALEKLKQWRKQILVQPTKKQVDTLIGLGQRVETLWHLTWRRLSIAESEIRRSIDVWGADGLPVGGAVTREQIEESLADPNGAYRRLRRVMDAWCAMWFWPLTEVTEPPSLTEWIETLQQILGRVGNVPKRGANPMSLGVAPSWEDLAVAEEIDLTFAGAAEIATVLKEHPWLAAVERVSAQQGFFHWDLDFAPVFSRGGFDLQVGNPPWVRPRSDVEALLAESDPWWQLKGETRADDALLAEHRENALSVSGTRELLLDGTASVSSIAAFAGAVQHYPHLEGLQPDLYRCFMELTWRNANPMGSVGLIHPETHFTDEKAGRLRVATYRRLRRHWQFRNVLGLFEIGTTRTFGVNVYGADEQPRFLNASYLYHPDTVERSIKHDGSGPEPGLKDEAGKWDLRPHASRIQQSDPNTLATWHAVLESDGVPVGQSRMVYTVNRSTAAVLDKIAAAPRIGDLGLSFSPGWHETNDRTKGYFDAEWGVPESWDSVILLGRHLNVANPFYQSPGLRSKGDTTEVDLEMLPVDAVPVTTYKPRGSRASYDASYDHWETGDGRRSARDFYRVAWRNMADNGGVRTLFPAIIPPGAAHINGVSSAGLTGAGLRDLAVAAGHMGSLLGDFAIRAAPKSTISPSTINRLPCASASHLEDALVSRVLRLNCLTSAWAALWESAMGTNWTEEIPLRRASDRYRAGVEIDVIVSIGLEVSADELIAIYRTQFPVLVGYDQEEILFDAAGRLVPAKVRRAWHTRREPSGPHDFPLEERTARHPGSGNQYSYELPYVYPHRETLIRTSFDRFEN